MQFIRIKKAAEALGVSVQTLYRWANSDPAFPPLVKLSQGATVIDQELLDAFVSARVQEAEKVKAERLALICAKR